MVPSILTDVQIETLCEHISHEDTSPLYTLLYLDENELVRPRILVGHHLTIVDVLCATSPYIWQIAFRESRTMLADRLLQLQIPMDIPFSIQGKQTTIFELLMHLKSWHLWMATRLDPNLIHPLVSGSSETLVSMCLLYPLPIVMKVFKQGGSVFHPCVQHRVQLLRKTHFDLESIHRLGWIQGIQTMLLLCSKTSHLRKKLPMDLIRLLAKYI
jgi:hypothetical protein